MMHSEPDWGALQASIAGEVVLPGAPEYESARKPAMARFHHVRPQAVVLCGTSMDVAETISIARRSGLHVAARSGGHCFAGHSSSQGIVIDVTPMRSVSVVGGVATVGAGARLGDLYDALEEHDLTIPAGCGPTVGIAGLTLGGGLGILGRKNGVTSDHLLGAEVVLADGRVVECDDQHDEDLFWALRGAGAGNFGVVTSLRFRTLPAPAMTSFHLAWPHSHAVAVIDAWQTWAPAAPDELAASLLLTVAGDVDRLPVVNLFGAMLGTQSDAAELLDEFVAKAGADPTSVTRRHMSYRETKRYLAEHGPGDDQGQESSQGHAFSKSEYLGGPLPPQAITALVDNFTRGRVRGESRELDFTPWRGAYNRVPANATAFVHRNEAFLLKHAVTVGPGTSTAEREAARRWLTRSWASVHPWGSGRVYQNFPDPELEDWDHAYYGTNHERLVRVKRRYDPGQFFRFPQSLSSQVSGRGT
jgi:FAD binding domain/Berberine and berberine like